MKSKVLLVQTVLQLAANAGNAQLPAEKLAAAGPISIGAELTALVLQEMPSRSTLGSGLGVLAGFQFADRWALHSRAAVAQVRYAQIPGSYDHFQLDVGGRYLPAERRGIGPYLEASLSAHVDRLDRKGITAGPDQWGAGAGIGAGAILRVRRDWSVVAGFDTRLSAVMAGRLETGKWEDLRDDRLMATQGRAHAGVSWHLPFFRGQ